MRKRIEVIIDSPQELNQSSYIRSGLFELENAGLIQCKVKVTGTRRLGRLDTTSGTIVRTRHPHPKTSFYTLIDPIGHRKISFATDMFDAPWYFSETALTSCDFVFKRNYVSRFISPLDIASKKKLLPLGLSFMVGADEKRFNFHLLIGLVLSNVRMAWKMERSVLLKLWKALTWSYSHWKDAVGARRLQEFEQLSEMKYPRVIFQTRCFPEPETADLRVIHQERAELIRLLAKELGSAFKGGFVPDNIASTQFPDCLTSLPTDPTSYLQMVNESAIGIYTRGISQSPAWKLAEYLAKGVCCVAEKLETELPHPLEHDIHLHYFSSPAQCVERCTTLLANAEERNRMSNNARKYYEEYVNPGKNILRMLELMLGRKIRDDQ